MLAVLLAAVGLLPFLFGEVLNWWIMTDLEHLPPLFWIGVLFLLLWALAAFVAIHFTDDMKKVAIPMNLVAFIDLVLLAVQELRGAYWFNAVGVWTQNYFLPLLRIGVGLAFWAHRMLFAYCIAFFLMVIASLIGCRAGKRRK